ncbi:MAG: UvrD-helicase domain-containing protein [Desulfatitalea sp.]|nr:UvrD-helicase domain-containing protein [Desulfatitalea sp.]
MHILADFHVHSKYSRATARNLDLENLYIAAQIKGIDVVATGDFTHPAWWAEIKAKLVPAEEGLFALTPEIARACDEKVPPSCHRPVRFILVTEISNIYKKEGRTRKNHNLIFMPDLPSAERLNWRLDAIGNVRSDGRPILGLDARNLLEILLETDSRGFLVPAHIWTPWFSLLGSKSGFDSVVDCFEDLTPHIFALETGLSSDPPMNRRVSGLDRFALISNSDAHSPAKLGREANRFDTEMGFSSLRAALEGTAPNGFLGTIEFFPQEGKYHLDGHRNCQFSCPPSETRALNNTCPVCGGPLVVGVLNRIAQLADRPEESELPADRPFCSLIPLEVLLAEVLQCGANTKTVGNAYWKLLLRHGSELEILQSVDPEALASSGVPLLWEAIDRMRRGQVRFEPGFDGAYGQVAIFNAAERKRLLGQQSLFAGPYCEPAYQPRPCVPIPSAPKEAPVPIALRPVAVPERQGRFILNAQQQQAVDYPGGPLLIMAGPGTGKTRTITCRMTALMADGRVPAAHILAVTFTLKAAREMETRLAAMLPVGAPQPTVGTFHALCCQWLRQRADEPPTTIIDDAGRVQVMEDARRLAKADGHSVSLSVKRALDSISRAKQLLLGPDEDPSRFAVFGDQGAAIALLYGYYQQLLADQQLIDFEGLIFRTVEILRRDVAWRAALQRQFTHIFVDEFQDLNDGQYALVRLLAPDDGDICVIGDPDQAIYGFRGANVGHFKRFMAEYPGAQMIHLNRNYRCPQTILKAAEAVIQAQPNGLAVQGRTAMSAAAAGGPAITFLEAATARAEAVAIGKIIEQMVGGTGFQAIDFGKTSGVGKSCSFADFAVLSRTGAEAQSIAEVLTRGGIPCLLANKERLVQKPPVAKLLAALRMAADQGTYGDLDHLTDLVVPGIGARTLGRFKVWAQGRRMPLTLALQAATRIPIEGMRPQRQHRLVALIRLFRTLADATRGQSVADTIQKVVSETTLYHRIDADDYQTVLSLADVAGQDLQALWISLAAYTDTDLYRPEAEKVALMTMHAAKGLEFPIVFITGCEAGRIPYQHSKHLRESADPDEERRLFYVAMTRAKKVLYLTRALRRTRSGANRSTEPSPFTADIPSHLLVGTRVAAKQPPPQQLTLF